VEAREFETQRMRTGLWKLWDEELDGEEECVRNLVDASAVDWEAVCSRV